MLIKTFIVLVVVIIVYSQVLTPWLYWNSLAQNGTNLTPGWCYIQTILIGLFPASRINNSSITQTGQRKDQNKWISKPNSECTIQIYCPFASTAKTETNGDIFCYRNMGYWSTIFGNYPQRCIPTVTANTCSSNILSKLKYLKQKVNQQCTPNSADPNSSYNTDQCCFNNGFEANPVDELNLGVASNLYWLKNIEQAC